MIHIGKERTNFVSHTHQSFVNSRQYMRLELCALIRHSKVIMNEKPINHSKNIIDYGTNIDTAIINSLHKYYGFEHDEFKTITHFSLEVNVNNDQFNPTENYKHKDKISDSGDNDIIGMMWEPELDFVDDPECYNECKNTSGPMRYMCGVCLGQFRTRSPDYSRSPVTPMLFHQNTKLICALDIHFRTHRGESLFKCVLCDGIFNELAALKQHRELHNVNELVTCGICGLVFTEMYNMIKHKNKYHLKEE